MTAKNAEGYPDPTAEEAIRHVMRGGKLDYTSFRTYEELQDYTIEHNKGISTRKRPTNSSGRRCQRKATSRRKSSTG